MTLQDKPPIKRPRKTPPHRHGWTPARRRAQAERIRRVQPWCKSTGPRTAAGKAAVRLNAYKHGWRSADMKEVYRLLRLQRAYVREMVNRHRLGRKGQLPLNEDGVSNSAHPPALSCHPPVTPIFSWT